MRNQYPAGPAGWRVYRGRGRGKKELECVQLVELPKLSMPGSAPDVWHPGMTLYLHFLSILDASEAMSISETQTISVRIAEEYWDIENAEIGIRSIEHVMRVKPRSLVAGTVSCQYGAKIYRLPPEPVADTPPGVRVERVTDQVEPLSFQRDASGGGPAGEYDVFYYAAYCDGKKLWEVCPEKRIFIVGGTHYPLPEKISE